MPQEIRMPSLGQTTGELRIVRWLRAEGDEVEAGDLLLEVETDKAILEVESFASGTLLKILREEDEMAEEGCLLAYIGATGEAIPAPEIGAREPAVREAVPAHEKPLQETPKAAGSVLAAPAVRKLARDRGIDLACVRGSGPGGRIEKGDLLAYLEKESAAEDAK